MAYVLILYWYSCTSAIETPRPRETVVYKCQGRGRE
jgi:hypothetical protein